MPKHPLAAEDRSQRAECQSLLARIGGRRVDPNGVCWPAVIEAARRHQVLPQLAEGPGGAALDAAAGAGLLRTCLFGIAVGILARPAWDGGTWLRVR